MLNWLIFIGCFVIIPLVMYQRLFPPYEDIFCSQVNFENASIDKKCYFQKNYRQSREQFLTLAKRCNAEIHSLSFVESEDLSTDIAILRGSKDKFLIHLSGTHGVEGYSGSAIQAASLHSICSAASSNPYPSDTEPTLVFVHALNPYGFHHNRRVNEDNIDLNRDPNHSGYETLNDLFNPTTPPLEPVFLNDLQKLFKSIQHIVKGEMKTIKAALVTGTYHNPKGVFYGGNKLAKSVSNLQEFFNRDDIGFNQAKKYVFIDVHTGLGPSGVDTYFVTKEDNEFKNRAEKFFPTEYSKTEPNKQIGGLKPWLSGDAEAVEDGYDESAGFTTDYFCGQIHRGFNPASRICLTQEFGTWPSLLVAKGFVDENQAHHYGNNEQKKHYGETLKRLFFVETKEWADSVVSRGTSAVFQAINYLKSE